jgi:hypothetical protein
VGDGCDRRQRARQPRIRRADVETLATTLSQSLNTVYKAVAFDIDGP